MPAAPPPRKGHQPTAAALTPAPACYLLWQFLAGINQMKFVAGQYGLAETIGVTILEIPFAFLPKRLERLRIGPLAPPERYSSRDWYISNCLQWTITLVYFAVNYKFIALCGWSASEFPWNLAGYPPSDASGTRSCNEEPQLLFAQLTKEASFQNVVGFAGVVFGVLFAWVGMFCIARKLPSWGEPPAPDAEEDKSVKSAVAKVAPAVIAIAQAAA